MRVVGAWFALFALVASLHVSFGVKRAEAAPAAAVRPLNGVWDRQKRAADDLWEELTEGGGRASDHEHWERIVRRSSLEWYDPYYEDDTQHIVDVQDYYRYVLEQDWYAEPQQDLLASNWGGDQARIQVEDDYIHMEKPIPGRYIVMLDASANERMLDHAITVLQQAHVESEGEIRTEHITPIRNLGLGFTATMNNKAVALVSSKGFVLLHSNNMVFSQLMLINLIYFVLFGAVSCAKLLRYTFNFPTNLCITT